MASGSTISLRLRQADATLGWAGVPQANEEFCRVLISQLNAHRVVLPKLAAGLKMCEGTTTLACPAHLCGAAR